MSIFIIAEAGVNHNGDCDLALQLIDAAAASGADAIKFQTFSAEKVVGPQASKAEYQKDATGDGSQFEMLKRLELSEVDYPVLISHCQQLGIEFMSTPFDSSAADFLMSHSVKRFKVPSGEITNHPFLAYLAATNVPLIVSTGMSTLEEVQDAVAVIKSARKANKLPGKTADYLTLLHCTSNYPAEMDDVHLLAMQSLGAKTELPVGYSDHTLGTEICVAAAALGATVLEKHFTLSRAMEGPDHKASLEPGELALLVEQVRNIEAALGNPEKQPSVSEMEMRVLARRSVVAAVDLSPGDILSEDNLAILRPASGIQPSEYPKLPGRVVIKSVTAGYPISWSDLAPDTK